MDCSFYYFIHVCIVNLRCYLYGKCREKAPARICWLAAGLLSHVVIMALCSLRYYVCVLKLYLCTHELVLFVNRYLLHFYLVKRNTDRKNVCIIWLVIPCTSQDTFCCEFIKRTIETTLEKKLTPSIINYCVMRCLKYVKGAVGDLGKC